MTRLNLRPGDTVYFLRFPDVIKAEIEFMAHDHVSLAYMEGDWLNKASRPYRDVFDDREKAEEVMAELLASATGGSE